MAKNAKLRRGQIAMFIGDRCNRDSLVRVLRDLGDGWYRVHWIASGIEGPARPIRPLSARELGRGKKTKRP